MEKNNKTLNVPHLRFPEFSGEWEIHKLSEYLDFKNGLNPDAKRFGRGLPFISVMDILADRVVCYDNIRAKVEATDKEIECFGVNKGDLLFQRSSETFEDVGRANVYMDNRTAIYGGFVIRGRKIGNYDPLFFKYLLATPLARKRTCRMGAGAQHFNIGQEGLSKISLHFPSIEEQSKIANLFSLIDERVETQKKVIEDLKRLKYAISKRVFSEMGQHHPVVKLGQLCSIKTGKLDANAMIDNGEFPFFTCAREDYRTDTYAFEGDSLLISGNGDIGIVKRYNGKFNAYQRTYVLQDFIQEIAYVQCFVEHHLPKRVLKEKNVGAMPYIVLSTLSEMPIILPPTYIQNAICKTIGAISEQINVEEKILANFELQKQYNLSMMFI